MNILGLFHNYTVEQITGIETNITADMYNAIELWAQMMSKNAPWNKKAHSCGILEQIAGRLSMLVSRELALEVENEAIKPALEHLDKNIETVVDYITLLGSCVIRPIYTNGKLQYEIIPLGNYLPIKYDFDGTLIGALLMKNISDGKKKFLLTEEHEYSQGQHIVKCQLYANDNGILRRANLSDCKLTADLTKEYVWQNVEQPMIIEFRNHAVNKIDGSNVPVAIIAGAEDLIKDADEQFERMNWEQKGGEMRLFADRDIFQRRQKRNGEETLSATELKPELNRLVVQVEGDGTTDGKKIVEHSPTLRTSQQNEMLQQIFRRIELTCNIGKGTISDMESQIQTATQYTGGRQELFAIVDKIEDEIEAKYHQCAKVFAYMSAAYKLGSNNSNITVSWNDDATRKDIMSAKTMAINEINAGIMSEWEYRRDFYGEDEATAKAKVPEKPLVPSPFDFGA